MEYKFFDDGRIDAGLTCPFCGEPVYLQACDAEGNWRQRDFIMNDTEEVWYVFVHCVKDETTCAKCPIATFISESLGTLMFDNIEEAIEIWNGKA